MLTFNFNCISSTNKDVLFRVQSLFANRTVNSATYQFPSNIILRMKRAVGFGFIEDWKCIVLFTLIRILDLQNWNKGGEGTHSENLWSPYINIHSRSPIANLGSRYTKVLSSIHQGILTWFGVAYLKSFSGFVEHAGTVCLNQLVKANLLA